MTGRRASDWLENAHYQGGERRAGDRRDGERRAPRWRFDPLFAATLVNHIAPPESAMLGGYAPMASRPRSGIVLNVRA